MIQTHWCSYVRHHVYVYLCSGLNGGSATISKDGDVLSWSGERWGGHSSFRLHGPSGGRHLAKPSGNLGMGHMYFLRGSHFTIDIHRHISYVHKMDCLNPVLGPIVPHVWSMTLLWRTWVWMLTMSQDPGLHRHCSSSFSITGLRSLASSVCTPWVPQLSEDRL